jgi:hypothetical protein
MCKPASFVMTKDRVYWSRKSDSHEDIIEEFGLSHLDTNQPGIARVELSPANDDLRTPIAEWVFKADQDILPEWWEPVWAEEQTRKVIAEWADAKLLLSGARVVKEGLVYAYGSATVEAYGSATVKAYGSATVKAYDSATVKAYDSATVEADDSATVEAYDGATVEAYGSATVKADDSATVEAYDGATVKAYDGATVKAYGSATVKAYGSATVKAYRSATVIKWGGKVELSQWAVLVDRSGDKPICTTVWGA